MTSFPFSVCLYFLLYLAWASFPFLLLLYSLRSRFMAILDRWQPSTLSSRRSRSMDRSIACSLWPLRARSRARFVLAREAEAATAISRVADRRIRSSRTLSRRSRRPTHSRSVALDPTPLALRHPHRFFGNPAPDRSIARQKWHRETKDGF